MSEQLPNPSGSTLPLWYDRLEPPDHRKSLPSLTTGVCVVGAGIAGLTTAYLLAREGVSVTVLDEKPVGGGETGRTSAHLASVIDDRFSNLIRLHELDDTKLHYQSHAEAINQIESICRTEGIDCDFQRLDGFLFAHDDEAVGFLGDEFAAARRIGVPGAELMQRAAQAGEPPRPCIRFPHQARFEPLAYLFGLAKAIERLGGYIRTGQRVIELSGDGPVTAKLDNGQVLTADAGVAATNVPTPINNWAGIYTKTAPYRTYMLGFEIPADAVPDALLWDTADPYHYARLVLRENRTILLVGGEDHRVGATLRDDPFRALGAWARTWFPVAGSCVSRWSGQVSEPVDGVAFIGRAPTSGHKGCYVITGDSGMGLTHGTLGAMLVTDLIQGRSNPWTDIYSPARISLRSAGDFVKENVAAVATMKDHLTPGDVESVDDIAPGSGAVIRKGARKLAVYRDRDGATHTCSAICPHLKCVVRWNATESSWDCPCHGSRFDAKGKLIIGPAIDDLPRE